MAVLATRAEVARLYGRAAFGATKADLDRGTTKTYADLVRSLFPTASADLRPPAPDDAERIDFEGSASPDGNDFMGPVTWWTERMRTTAWPLEERLTLAWHDHFATAFGSRVTTDLVTLQNQTLRVHALGDFRALVHAMTVDPAMLQWLNGSDSLAPSKVNENYAREFLELFTVGVRPPGTAQEYLEEDIQQIAPVFAGWHWQWKRGGELHATSQFNRNVHSWSTVTLRGDTSPACAGPTTDASHLTDHHRVTQWALARPGAARHVASRLVRNLAYEPDPVAVFAGTEPLVEAVATALRPANVADPAARWDIAAAVRALLLSPSFRGAQPPARQGARQPVEILVHGAKVLGVDLYEWTWRENGLPSMNDPTGTKVFEAKFVAACARAGQVPMRPPSVGGWPVGAEWFTTMANLARYEILHVLYDAWAAKAVTSRPLLPAANDVAGWTAFMGLAALSPQTAARLTAFLADTAVIGEPARQRGVFLLIGTSPDWQVM